MSERQDTFNLVTIQEKNRAYNVLVYALGNTGAADSVRLIENGHKVYVHTDPKRSQDLINHVEKDGLQAYGDYFNGNYHPNVVRNLAEVMPKVDAIINTVLPTGQAEAVRELFKHTNRKQVYYMIHGLGHAGWVKTDEKSPHLLVDVNTAFQGSRVQKDGEEIGRVHIGASKANLTLYARRTDEEIASKDPFDIVSEDDRIMTRILFPSPNAIWNTVPFAAYGKSSAFELHAPPTLLGMIGLSHDKCRGVLDYYKDHVGNAFARNVILKLDEARVEFGGPKWMNWNAHNIIKACENDTGRKLNTGNPHADLKVYADGRGRPPGAGYLPEPFGPYVVDEILCHMVPLYAMMVVADFPIKYRKRYEGFIVYASMVYDRDFMSDGMNAEKLGIADMTAGQFIEKYRGAGSIE